MKVAPLIVMSDGGLRQGHGSAAWVIFLCRAHEIEVVHIEYKHWRNAKSAFQCEMIAMSEAIATCRSMLFRHHMYLRT